MTTEITFFGRLPGNNGVGGLLRLHWAKRKKLAERLDWIVRASTTYCHLGAVHLELVRYTTSSIQLDFDNLVSTGKYPIDAIVRRKVIVDDNPNVIVSRVYRQEKVKNKDEQRTVISLVDVE